MNRFLLLGYVVLYSVLSISLLVFGAVLRPEEGEPRDEPWEALVDAVLMAVGLAGMLLFVYGVQDHWLKAIWRSVSVCLLLVQVILNVKGRIDYLRSHPPSERRIPVVPTDLLTLFLLGPSLVLNLVYAFG